MTFENSQSMVLYTMPLKVQTCGLTNKGLVRQNNEDVWDEIPERNFYLIADGMGGHQAGEVASLETVKTLCRIIRKQLPDRATHKIPLKEMREIVFHAIEEVNTIVYQLGSSVEELKGMGTTLCCVCLQEDGLVYAHVGDSRIYRLRKEKLKLLTKDDSLLWEMLDLGQIDESQVMEFQYKNILTKAIGTGPFVVPTVHVGDLHDGDLYLLCTDGLTDLLSREEIESILNRSLNLKSGAETLIATANEKGGHDNITVVLVQVQKADES